MEPFIPRLGWIAPEDRTDEQNAAHERALATMTTFALPFKAVPKGTKVILTDFLKAPEVIEDMGGREFTGFHQLTGSCGGVSAGNGAAVLSAAQRCVADNPQKSIVPWWGLNYGTTRRAQGERGPGEGIVCSIMSRELAKGVVPITHPKLHLQFKMDDGWYLTEAVELLASDPRKIDPELETAARSMPIGTVAPVYDTTSLAAGIVNGYPNNNGCGLFVNSGANTGSGNNAYVRGRYDTRGGHATCFVGYWEHPTDGPLFLYWNQWPTQTYATDPAGGPRCSVWVPEAEVAKAFRQYGMGGGESFLLSHLTTFPAQPKVLDWIVAP